MIIHSIATHGPWSIREAPPDANLVSPASHWPSSSASSHVLASAHHVPARNGALGSHRGCGMLRTLYSAHQPSRLGCSCTGGIARRRGNTGSCRACRAGNASEAFGCLWRDLGGRVLDRACGFGCWRGIAAARAADNEPRLPQHGARCGKRHRHGERMSGDGLRRGGRCRRVERRLRKPPEPNDFSERPCAELELDGLGERHWFRQSFFITGLIVGAATGATGTNGGVFTMKIAKDII